MTDWGTRLRAALDDRFALIVVACVCLALVGGWVTYTTYVTPGTHTEVREDASWTTTAEFDHSATVTEPNSLYDIGTTLANRETYYAAISPVLNGTFDYGYRASGGGNLSVAAEPSLVVRSVDRDGRDGEATVYWRTERSLDRTEVDGVAPGERIQVPFSVNVSAVRERTERIEEELGATPGETEAVVRVVVTRTGTVNGERVERSEEYALPITPGSAYRVEDPGAVTNDGASRQRVTVPNEHGALRRAGGPLLLVVALGAAGGLVAARAGGRLQLSEHERERLAFDEARAAHDEWISVVSLPAAAHELPRAEAASLGDLVDVAIDTDNAVVEDPDDGRYYVVHDGYCYVYTPPDTDQSTATHAPERADGESTAVETDDQPPDEDAPEPTA